ncbi:MAG: septation regulator SpoVG [Ruminococcus sp.]|nr:septation regulator SpoVG [Ruminococcus sp.]
MKITEVKVRRLMNEGRLRGIVSVTFDGVFAVHDIKIVQGDHRLFVAMPSRRDESGIFRDIVHPMTLDARNRMEEQILDAFHREKAKTTIDNL